MNIPPEVTVALNRLPIIQHSLRDISVQLADLNILKNKVLEVKADIWERDGIDHRLSNVGQQCEDNFGDIYTLKQANDSLRKDVDLLKAIVIKLDKKVNEQEEIVELKGRSMRDNILIHNFEEQDSENLHVRINDLFKEHFDMDVKFVRIHRNGGNFNSRGKPRSITGKLVDFAQKERILKAQKDKLNNKETLPFHVTTQSPASVNENRKKLFEISAKHRAEGTNTRVVGNKLIYPNGSVYREKVPTPTARDILSMDEKEQEKLDKIKLEKTNNIIDNGNKFLAVGGRASCYAQVNNIYKEVMSDPTYASADHKILVYKFTDEQGKSHDGYNDDGEHGSGRKLLKKLQENNIADMAVVVIRYFSGKHIGPRRFTIMEDLAMDAAQKIRVSE